MYLQLCSIHVVFYSRQAIEKHHFMTPDTPVVDELELPSRLLRDASNTHTCSSTSQVIKPSSTALESGRIKGSIMTRKGRKKKNFRSTLAESQKKEFLGSEVENGREFKTSQSIDNKLNFLKQTLANELNKISSDHQQENAITITTTSTQSPASHQQHNLPHITSDPDPHETSHQITNSASSANKVSKKAKKLKDDKTDRIKQNVKTRKGEMEQKHSREGVNVSQTSSELDSVRLMSCDNSHDNCATKLNTSNNNREEEMRLGDYNGEYRDNTSSDGDDDMEIVRGVAGMEEDPVMMTYCSPILTATSPFLISPGKHTHTHTHSHTHTQL